MHLSTHIDALATAFPECDAIAYVDIGARMILVKSTSKEILQERWDALCETGVDFLSGEPARLAAGAMRDGAAIGQAMIVERDEIAIFLRSSVVKDDAIFCVARPWLDAAAFIETAGQALERIAQDE